MRSLIENQHGASNEEESEGDDVMGWTMSSWVEEQDVKEGVRRGGWTGTSCSLDLCVCCVFSDEGGSGRKMH